MAAYALPLRGCDTAVCCKPPVERVLLSMVRVSDQPPGNQVQLARRPARAETTATLALCGAF